MSTLTRLPELDAYVQKFWERCENLRFTSAADIDGRPCQNRAVIEVDGLRLCQECAEFMEVL
jgi:hypothetical protein